MKECCCLVGERKEECGLVGERMDECCGLVDEKAVWFDLTGEKVV